jgi:peptide/nickel transport system permease protein
MILYYILKRLGLIIPVIIGITLFIFFILALAPGDPASIILGTDAMPSEIIAKRIELGLDKPIIVRYLTYMKGVLHGDFGRSWLSGKLVFDEFKQRIPHTFMLAWMTTLITTVFGISFGIIAAVRQNHPIDYGTLAFALVGSSIPSFWFGMFAQIIFALTFGWFPAMGVGSFKHYILPAFTLSVGGMAGQIRMTRSSMLDVINQDYVRTTRAKGAGEFRVITRHVVRNGFLPIVTNIGLLFASILSGAIVSETVFSIPGIGAYMINAAKSRDVPIVMGVIFFVAIFTAGVNLIVDFIYAFIDPRVKLE